MENKYAYKITHYKDKLKSFVMGGQVFWVLRREGGRG